MKNKFEERVWKVTALSTKNPTGNFDFHACGQVITFSNGVAFVNDESILQYFTRTGRFEVEEVIDKN